MFRRDRTDVFDDSLVYFTRREVERRAGLRPISAQHYVWDRRQNQSNAGSLGGGARRSRQLTAGNRCL